MRAFGVADKQFLSRLRIAADDQPAIGELECAYKDLEIACGLFRNEEKERRRWQRIAFRWCSIAVVATAMAGIGWLFALLGQTS